MSTATHSTAIDFDSFCVVVKEDQAADLINGVFYMASRENLDANQRFMWLGRFRGNPKS